MRNIWLLFKSDLKRVLGNVVTIIIVLGLVALPSLFSWYNIIACWSVFDNTGNLTVAVANTDKGYTSDLVPLKVSIGDQVTSALRENDQLNWVFTNEDDAIDGVQAGRYYAAVVIPQTFSADMMSFFSNDVEHAKITYYSNQKKSAIAPKVTDQGADRVSNQVNQVFAETVSEIALGISSALLDYAEQSGANGRLADLASHVETLGNQIRDSASMLSSYSAVISSAQGLVLNSGNLLANVKSEADAAAASSEGAKDAARQAADTLGAAAAQVRQSLTDAASVSVSLPSVVDEAYEDANVAARDAEKAIREMQQTALDLGFSQEAQQLGSLAESVHTARVLTQATRIEAKELATSAQAQLAETQNDFDTNVRPTLESLSSVLDDANQALAQTASQLESTSLEIVGSTDSISARLAVAHDKVDSAAAQLGEGAASLDQLSANLEAALASDDVQLLRTVIGSDPDALATAIAAPVQLERIAVYPVDNFGSAMSPLYTTLALWIGALLIMVTLKMQPSARTLEELGNPTSRQVFAGRFGIVALIAFMQSTVLSLGNLWFLDVQAVNPVLYVLCFWVAGFVFTFIIYTLVALFANLGKALSVVLLIVQVSGGGGSFPLQLLPDFFQTMSPYLPITHAVRAMRAAMFGLYQGDFWMEIGSLLLFMVPIAILGIALHYPLGKIVPKFIARVEKSKLM